MLLTVLALDCVCSGSNIWAQSVQFLVVAGLFPDSFDDFLVQCLSMGIYVPANGKNWEIINHEKGYKMQITIGTFNLNNLFSRYNFMGEIEAINDGDTEVGAVEFYNFDNPKMYKIRKFMGRLVKAKPEAERLAIAQRIIDMNVDVLCRSGG